ncbi:hypothetical protein [Zeaxanthinibacter enoshimensis]|uniref:Uncharacterized protein n=1 Tax=Zeaxanthinibacter enoshimensis TaxID=392009 RepID=A0A4R6TQD2_9FLAO|nr:hypothetical protein [Zeaxanthinibacter enoshimensis]TDQ32323.1 hypothetical protein CLV82_0147 [Zeaxanthinibacter enoshimensis]
MKTRYLFDPKWKKWGWIILIPAILLGLFTVITDWEPALLDIEMYGPFITDYSGEGSESGYLDNNLMNEICGILLILGGLLVAFSKQQEEDEFIQKLRLESLVWATYGNYIILILGFVFVYDFGFFWVMLFNMFTVLLLFILKFHWDLWKLKQSLSYAE